MEAVALDVNIQDTSVVKYIDEIKAQYEHQLHKKNKIIIDLLEYKNKYLEMEEKYTLLLYKRFMRSAERLSADENQPLLFTSEAEEKEVVEEAEPQEKTEVKSHRRRKPGRKPLDPNLPRERHVIDIPECEKICTCGAVLTKIGEETAD